MIVSSKNSLHVVNLDKVIKLHKKVISSYKQGTFVNISSQPFSTTDMCTDHIVSITPRMRMENGHFRNALEQCTAAMKQVMALAFPQQDPNMDYKCIFLVDASLAGLMIGKGGERIASLRRDHGVQVQLQKPPEVILTVNI